MLGVTSRLIVLIGLLGLLPQTLMEPASGAAATLSSGWSSVDLGPPVSYTGPVSPPFFVVRGGPGLVAISQAGGGGNTPDVWVSADGRHWQYKTLDRGSFANVIALSAPVLGKRGLVMVGTAQGAPASGHAPVPQGIVWTSTSGVSWQRVPDSGNVFKGATLTSVTAGGPGYVAVGTFQTQPSPTPAVNYRASIWISSDGTHWQKASEAGPGFGSAFIRDVATGGPGLVAVGFANPIAGHPSVPAIWSSVSGKTWRRLSLGPVFGTGGGIDRIVSGQQGLLALGHDALPGGLQHQIVWTSRDGVHWRRVAVDPFGVGHSPPVLTAAGSSFVAVGQYDNAPALWSSADGSHWSLMAGSDVFGGGLTTLVDAVQWRGGLLVIGQHSDPLIVSPTGHVVVSRRLAWLWTPGASNAPHPNWAASDPMWFRLRLSDLGPRFIPRFAGYTMGCELIPDLGDRTQPAEVPGLDTARCKRALAALQGSVSYSFNFGYGASNLYGPEPEVTGFAILTTSAAQSRAAYKWGGGIVIAGDLNENIGIPRSEGNVRMAQSGTLYSIATHGFGTAYAVVWRDGRALGMVEVVGVPGGRARVVALARAQWQHWKAVGR